MLCGRDAVKSSPAREVGVRVAALRLVTQEPPATLLLRRLDRGDRAAASELFALVYDELRRLAATWSGGDRSRTPTLPPTALVHEAYAKLVQVDGLHAASRAHFFRLAAKAMRSVLVDHARARAARKRGGGQARRSITTAGVALSDGADQTLEIDELLTALASTDESAAQVVEMRLFGGLSSEEIADTLGVSSRTVERTWRAARAWLQSKLAPEGGSSSKPAE